MALHGKVAMVTGAARGIGLACAKSLGMSGAKVMLLDVDAAAGRQAAEDLARDHGIQARFRPCDVGSKVDVDGAVAETVEAFGGLDICVSNAGILRVADFLDLSESDWDAVIRVNLTGVFLTGQASARQMVAQNRASPGRGGVIINMSSVNGVTAIPGIAPYNAAKGGVNNLTRNMALSLASHGIRVNGIGPGSINTEVFKMVSDDEEKMRGILSRTPMGRVGEPSEIGEICVFLASQQSSYITGQILYADGGRLALNYTCPVPE
mmetsp:Transcript_15858/g.40430  ORF Transcript_15858/g.40430 Transcript_15858/m.40430 type:complete len:265 (+) Transcript_15858:94-888(+)